MAKNKPINLLPQEEFEASTLGRVLRWAMGTFRIIVVVTEMVVMSAFLSRFWLDAQNADLSDSIKVKSAEISSLSDTETEFRNIQTKLSIFKTVSANNNLSGKLDLIASLIPSNVILSSLAVDGKTIDLRGSSTSETSIAQFLSNLKAQSSLKTIELGGVSSSQNIQGALDFSVKITY